MHRDCSDGYHSVFKQKERKIKLNHSWITEELHACKYCDANVTTRTLPDGSMLNEVEYMKLAKKDFIQKGNKDFERFYKKDDWDEMVKDKYKAEHEIEDGKNWNQEFKKKIDKGQKVYGI